MKVYESLFLQESNLVQLLENHSGDLIERDRISECIANIFCDKPRFPVPHHGANRAIQGFVLERYNTVLRHQGIFALRTSIYYASSHMF